MTATRTPRITGNLAPPITGSRLGCWKLSGRPLYRLGAHATTSVPAM
jgi:hypothetical protein